MCYQSPYTGFSCCCFFCFYWSIPMVLQLDYLWRICHILIVQYTLLSCLTHVVLESIHLLFFHSTAAVLCHRSQLPCAVSAGTATVVVHNRSRSLLVHPVASHSKAAVRCHRPQLLCPIAALTAAAVVPQPPPTATVHSFCAPLPPSKSATTTVRPLPLLVYNQK
jgi:hypothetical protein